MTPIAIALLTCERASYTEKVLSALARHNDLSGLSLFYADDNSQDSRVHEVAARYGFELVFLNTGPRMGCSPMTDALWQSTRDRIGDDGIILSLQNDFECIRPLPWGLIVDALQRPDVVCVKLWDRAIKGRIVGPRTRILRHAKWHRSNEYPEPVTIARTGWGFGPQAIKAHLACRIVRRASRELGVMKQAARLGGLVVRPESLCFRHIGNIKTPRGIYKSKQRFAGEAA
jgi:hypothetical protein